MIVEVEDPRDLLVLVDELRGAIAQAHRADAEVHELPF
jgi:hypothetical protein